MGKCYDDAQRLRLEMDFAKDAKYILSYGGGINSSALFFYLIDNHKPIDLLIFADTGEESKSTYNAVERMKLECKKHSIEFVTVQSTYGKLYDYYFSHKTVPSMMRRDCTSKFKVAPIRQYIRARYGKQQRFIMYIGIAVDEFTRMTMSDVKYIVYTYPFCDAKLTRQDNINILQQHKFPASKSGCVGCIYNKKSNWIKLLREDPKEFDRWLLLDVQNRRYPEVLLCGRFKLKSLKDNIQNQTLLESFEEPPDPQCSVSGGCFL